MLLLSCKTTEFKTLYGCYMHELSYHAQRVCREIDAYLKEAMHAFPVCSLADRDNKNLSGGFFLETV